MEILDQDREIAPISLPPVYQCRLGWRNGHVLRTQLIGMLHQEPRVKSGHFLKKHLFLEKCLRF